MDKTKEITLDGFVEIVQDYAEKWVQRRFFSRRFTSFFLVALLLFSSLYFFSRRFISFLVALLLFSSLYSISGFVWLRVAAWARGPRLHALLVGCVLSAFCSSAGVGFRGLVSISLAVVCSFGGGPSWLWVGGAALAMFIQESHGTFIAYLRTERAKTGRKLPLFFLVWAEMPSRFGGESGSLQRCHPTRRACSARRGGAAGGIGFAAPRWQDVCGEAGGTG